MSDDTIGTGQPGQDAFTPVEELSYEQARDELIETCLLYTSPSPRDS